MGRGLPLAAAAAVCGLAALGAGLGAAPAGAAPARVWVGTVTATYTATDVREGPNALDQGTTARATIRAYADGTATVAVSYRHRTEERGATCDVPDLAVTTAEGAFVGRGSRPLVSVERSRRYRISYVVPPIPARAARRYSFPGGLSCPAQETSEIETRLFAFPTRPGEGRAGSRTPTRLQGATTFSVSCGPVCAERWRVAWRLTLVRARPKGRGGGQAGRTGSAGPARTGCRAALVGTPAADELAGTAASERLQGLAGDDLLRGSGGADCLHGDEGADTLRGEAGNDLLAGGPGPDVLEGGPGADLVLALDGEPDVVRCGPGRDVAWADPADRTLGCETVLR